MKDDLIPDQILCQAGINLLVMLISAWLGFRFGRVAERRNEFRKEQLRFVPLIEQVISAARNEQPMLVRRNNNEAIHDAARRLKMHLNGRRFRRFEAAWQIYGRITDEELFPYNSPGFRSKGKDEDLRATQQILIQALSRMLDCARGA
jgi:hypothetical protein